MIQSINKDTKIYCSFSENAGNKGCQFFNPAFFKYNINAIYKSFSVNNIDNALNCAKFLKFNYTKFCEFFFKNKFENKKKVTIKKYPKKIKNNNSLKIITLAKNKIIPSVNFLEINVYKNNGL